MKNIKHRAKVSLLTAAMMATSIGVAGAQTIGDYDGAKLRFGLFGGGNFNSIGVAPGNLPGDLPGNPSFLTEDLSDGTGWGPYGGLLVEYNTGKVIGVQFRLGYDDRSATLDDGSRQLQTKLRYVSLEPALRVNLASPAFAFMIGPSINFNINNTYDYMAAGAENPTIADGELDNVKGTTFGMWGGVGYDIALNSEGSPRWYLTPFFEGSWLVDQTQGPLPGRDNLDDNWSSVTVRGGLQLKFGSAPVVEEDMSMEPAPAPTTVGLSIRGPVGGVTEPRELREYFPIRNYLFFPDGSTSIPARYRTMSQTDAQSFNENELVKPVGAGAEDPTRSQRQMDVYYNMVNVVGSRLRSNPSAGITVVGAAPNSNDARAMAQSVKDYLVSTYGIESSRISVEARERPPHASGSRATPQSDLGMVAEENRRVEILSDNQELLKPVRIRSYEDEPLTNDLVINVRSITGTPVASWSMTVSGEGMDRNYGPFYGGTQRIPAAPIIGDRDRGEYTATVTAKTREGETLTVSEDFSLTRRTQPPLVGNRFSILFEYDESKTVATYEDFLRNELAPQIPDGSSVFIHGHTDAIGEEDYNLELSAKRASAVEEILRDQLDSMGRSVTFDSYGFGENERRSPFLNATPEGRQYNRTVVIEVIPGS